MAPFTVCSSHQIYLKGIPESLISADHVGAWTLQRTFTFHPLKHIPPPVRKLNQTHKL